MVDSIRNNLFKDIDTNTALDLVSFNIQVNVLCAVSVLFETGCVFRLF